MRIVFEGEPAVKVNAKNVERLGLARMETPDKTKSPWVGFTVLDLQTNEDLILLGFGIMPQGLHQSWILAKSCKGGSSSRSV